MHLTAEQETIGRRNFLKVLVDSRQVAVSRQSSAEA
jgi:hypothetical protein